MKCAKQICFWLALSFLFGNVSLANIHDKSRSGLSYNFGFTPKISQFIDNINEAELTQFHLASLLVQVPYNKYFSYGFSLDFMYLESPFYDMALMGSNYVNASAMGLTLNGSVRPQIPVPLPFGDFWFFLAIDGGLGGTPALFMGSHNLSRRTFKDRTTFPSPFPLIFNTAAQIGVEYYFAEFFGIEFSGGYRVLWFVHPFVTPDGMPGLIPAEKSLVAYDASAFFAGASFKIAF